MVKCNNNKNNSTWKANPDDNTFKANPDDNALEANPVLCKHTTIKTIKTTEQIMHKSDNNNNNNNKDAS